MIEKACIFNMHGFALVSYINALPRPRASGDRALGIRRFRGRPGFQAARDTSIRHTNLRHPEPKTARGLQDTPTALQEASMTAQEASKTA